MTKKEIIDGLQFTIDMFLSDPLTGEPITKPRNDMDKTTIDVCKGAIELLEQQPCEDKIIEWKKDFKEYVNSLSMLNDDYKGIMEYIDELLVTSELCEDAISREQVINAVADLFEMNEYPHPYPQGKPIRLKDIKEKLKQLPPAQPKIKTGHWIKITPSGIYMCSECEQNVLTGDIDAYHYCHHCGIKMINVPDINDGKLHRSCTEVAQAQNNRKVSDKK